MMVLAIIGKHIGENEPEKAKFAGKMLFLSVCTTSIILLIFDLLFFEVIAIFICNVQEVQEEMFNMKYLFMGLSIGDLFLAFGASFMRAIGLER